MERKWFCLLGFGAAILPVVLRSIYHTGYGLTQLVDPRIFFYMPALIKILITTVVLCLPCLKGKKAGSSFVIGFSVGLGFILTEFFHEYPLDYKLWTYIIAPSAIFTFLMASTITIVIIKLQA